MNKSSQLLTTPIFALFVFALFVRRPKRWAVWLGAAVGIATAACIAFSGPLAHALGRRRDAYDKRRCEQKV